ncbi:Microtubule-actin cross-linking factor 1, isoforms 1/2/3/5 [Liparis tanakae]|uniref:Microtubule-actin cross-linking factor 1, isoforms 1/2/3/5 n=1 Tax=Liparis tanakae TaxID=230148 RepID=A0A4Z2GC34_9TELE|nr:Microtubule-actin cross-linking factor 1, isoforms 1/2/3/5 [Liparis tanakae]
MSRVEVGEAVQCEAELARYLQDCESLIGQLDQDLQVLHHEKYYQVEQLVFRVSCLQEELVSLRLQCSSVYRKGHFSQRAPGSVGAARPGHGGSDGGPTLGQTLLGAAGAVGAAGAALLRRPTPRAQLVAMSSSEDEGSLRFIYELLGWVEETQENLQEHNAVNTAVEELVSSLQEARSYEARVSPNFRSNYSETLAKLEHQYCKLREHSSWRLRSLESLHALVAQCTEELIWLNEREEEEIAFDWSDGNAAMSAKRDAHDDMKLELQEKRDVMRSLQETAGRLCLDNHPAKQTVEAYSAALQTQGQWVDQLCVCVEQHLKDNTAYFQFMGDARDCESYLRQLQETIKRQYTCDKNSRLSKLEDLLQDSMITIARGEECVLEDNSQRTKWKVISPTGNEAMVPSVCFTVPPPNQEATDTAGRAEQLYQKVMSLWHELHVNMKAVVSWHYLLKDIRTVSGWSLDTVRGQAPAERQQVLDHLESQLADFLSDSKESAAFTAGERREVEKEAQQARKHCEDLLLNMETVEKDESVSRSYLSELQDITLRLNDAEHRLMRGIQTPPPSRLSLGDGADNSVQIAEQEKLQAELDAVRSSLGDVSRRCVAFFEEKPALKAVEVVLRGLDEAESQVRSNEGRLSEEDVVPADTESIQSLRDQLGSWRAELEEQEGVVQALQPEVARAKEAGARLSRLHPDRSAELERYQETANQMEERWGGVKRQVETRRSDLEALSSALRRYRSGHSALIGWIEETTERQENTRPGLTDSRALSEQLAQQTAMAEIEQNQAKLDECQTHSKVYCTSVKDYELQLMTYRAFVETTHKSPVKRRRMHSSSDAITQEFMDLRTRYTALVTLTTQHVKYISDALRRLEEEEKEVEEEKQARVGQVSDLLGWVQGLQGRSGGPNAESSLAAQQKQIAIAGVIDLGTVETFPVFKAAQRGLIDQDTCHVLLEVQLIMGGLLQSDSPLNLTLEQGLAQGLIDTNTRQSLSELERALLLVENSQSTNDHQQQHVLPVVAAMEFGLIGEEVGLRILELQMNTGGLRSSMGTTMSLEQADVRKLLTPRILNKLQPRQPLKELVDPNTAEKLNLHELQERCVLDDDSGLLLLPVKQQPGGTVCLRSGRKVGIFRAVQEGLIDRKVTVRLLEAQLFAGGIADPRSGHRLTVHEAVRHGLMDQDLASAMLARQLQHGGILDPFSGERLDLEEGIRRDLLSPDLALLVLESLWAFMGILWPQSGELLPIAEALQQGVISGELSRNILRQRHAIGALYNPETLMVLPLNQAAEEALEPSVVSLIKNTHIPDVLSSMNQSGTPSLNRSSWGSTSTSPPPSSPSSPTGLVWDATPTAGMDPEEQAQQKLLFHLMTHSYVDAHSGKRLVLLDPELGELVKATELIATASRSQVEPQSSVSTDEQGGLQMGREFSLADVGRSDTQTEVEEESSDVVTPNKEVKRNGTGSLEEKYDGENESELLHKPPVPSERDLAFEANNERCVDKDVKEKAQKKEIFLNESLMASAKRLEGPDELVATEFKSRDSGGQQGTISTTTTEGRTHAPKPFKSIPLGAKAAECVKSKQSDDRKDIKHSQTELERTQQKVSVTETGSKHAKPVIDIRDSAVEKEGEDAELAKLVLELKRGGLMTEEGEKLLPDEAVAQGVLPGHTAVKLMAKSGLFGGFLDASSGESLSMEDVMQEGLLDEDLMWSVLKSEKTLAGVVDVEKKQICGVREAAQAGLIDPNTAARLLEAQVVSGGIVDLHRDKKVSVTLAVNLGLIEEDQREELVALEKACKGKDTDSTTALTKASLQLQMEGVIDPESKSPLPLEQAIQKGLIRSEEAYQVLARQVAEGGIIHHASGMRLSVPDAVDRGLVDRSIAPGLEELEWVYQGKVSPSSHPEAVVFQASTGAILDPDSGCKLTLTEAVSRGLLDENVASDAMASSAVTRGALDPETALIVPYSELVNRGKIDIDTGKRFLEVKPFRGVQDGQTGNILTLPEAVASKQVDPAPALRLLQSQADSGGIIDIRTGERLPISEACKRGLVDDNMARVIATKQFLKGGLVDPATGQQISNLEDAIAKELISSDMASEIQEKLASVEMGGDESSATPVASSNAAAIMSVSSPDSPANRSDVKSEELSRSPLSKKALEMTLDNEKSLTSVVSDQSLFYGPMTEDDNIEVSVEEKAAVGPDQSLELLSEFVTNVEKRVQEAIEGIVPQTNIWTSEPLPPQEGVCKTDYTQKGNVFKDGLRESTQAHVHDADKDLQGEVRKEASVLKLSKEPVSVGKKECRPSDEGTSMVHHYSEDGKQAGFVTAEFRDDGERKDGIEVSKLSEVNRKSDVGAQREDVEDEKSNQVERGKPKDEEQSDPSLTSPPKETESKGKKKRKNKRNGKHTEAERETHLPEIKQPSQIEAIDVVTSQDAYQQLQIQGQVASPRHPEGEREAKIEAPNDLVKQGQEAVPATLESTENTIEPEKDAIQIALLKDTEIGDKRERKRKEQKEKVQEKDPVSQRPEQPDSRQEVTNKKKQELPQKSALPNEEKAALVLKAKESILKKVFEKGVSEKQAAEELQTLRKEVRKKESRGKAAKTQTASATADGVEGHDDGVKRPNGSPKETRAHEDEITLRRLKEDETEKKLPVKEDMETKASSNEKEKNRSFGKEDVEAAPSVQPKETEQSKRKKKNKKTKSHSVADKTEPGAERLLAEKVDSDVTTTPATEQPDPDTLASTREQKMDPQSASGVGRPSVVEGETFVINVEGAEASQQSPPHSHQSEEPYSHVEEHVQLAAAASDGKEESHSETRNAAEAIGFPHEAVGYKPDIRPTAQSMAAGTLPAKPAGRGRKKRRHQPPEVDGAKVPDSKDQQQLIETPDSAPSLSEDTSTESASSGEPEADAASESRREGEDDVGESPKIVSSKEARTSSTGKVGS